MKWQKRKEEEIDPALIEKYQLSPIAAKLFSLRKINTDEKLDFWFNADENNLADPSLMHDLDKAVERINQGRSIMVKRLPSTVTTMQME